MPTPASTGAIIAIAGVLIVLAWQLHLDLLFSDTTTTGGDMGAHYILPSFLADHLLPHLTGWDPGWYDGFPLYTYYFVLPDLFVALLSHLFAYNIVFKLATVSGSFALPIAAWAFARLCGLRAPIPASMAAATLPYLFDPTWTIDGGNLFSTLAGEYSYSLSLSFALVFLGVLVRYLRSGEGRTLAALLLAATVLAHLVPTLYALVGGALFVAVELARRARSDAEGPGRAILTVVSRVAFVLGGGLGLVAWWLVPFVTEQAYATSMNYSKVTTYIATLFPRADWWVLALALLATMTGWKRRDRVVMVLSVLGGVMAAALVLDPSSSIYNMRFLPLWFLSCYLLAGWGVGTASLALANRRPVEGVSIRDRGALGGAIVAISLALVAVVPGLISSWSSALGEIGITDGANQVSVWSRWNYSGYEAKSSWPEFKGLMNTMSKVGATHGCGRAMWEYNSNQNRFGTPEALMDLPYFTDGCIDSEEGLLFESAATTPFHFLDQAELSASPSEAVAGLPYGSLDVALGVKHLQLMGVRYFMGYSPGVVAAADLDPTLVLVATSGPWQPGTGATTTTNWSIFMVKHSTVVQPLANEPVVVSGVGAGQSSWLGAPGAGGQLADGPALRWFLHPAQWGVYLAANGPSSWSRQSATARWPTTSRSEPHASITDVVQTTSSIRFTTSRVGVPVLVKLSYFPAWHASGAAGPYRVAPNLMVVVPTAHVVTLSYGSTPAQSVGEAVTILSLVGLSAAFVLRRRRRRALR